MRVSRATFLATGRANANFDKRLNISRAFLARSCTYVSENVIRGERKRWELCIAIKLDCPWNECEILVTRSFAWNNRNNEGIILHSVATYIAMAPRVGRQPRPGIFVPLDAVYERRLLSLRFKGIKNWFFFCIFLKDTVSKTNLCNLTCELLKLTKLWLFEGRDDQLNFKGIFLETMFLRTVSMISQNLLDQLTQNFKYAFSTRLTIALTRINQKISFFIFF